MRTKQRRIRRATRVATMRGALGAWLALLVWLVFPAAARAEPFAMADVPVELRSWIPWVLDGVGTEVCPLIADTRVCVWPGTLRLELAANGGRFEQRAVSDRNERLLLPGSEMSWPHEVTLNGKSVPVLSDAGTPYIDLPSGDHVVEGRFSWERPPEVVRVPTATGLVALVLSGRPILFPKRDEDGSVWLQAASNNPEEPERLDIEVFRRIDDGIPMSVTTRLVLTVSGRAREVNLGNVLLADSRALSLKSPLPARIEASGELAVQVRPGEHRLEVKSLIPTAPDQLLAPQRPAPWPASETWVWVPNVNLRQVELSGAAGIDASRTNLDTDWREFGAYTLESGTALRLVTSRRGEATPAPNRLKLHRDIWLDLDGKAFTVRDQLSGELSQSWRLNLAQGELGHVAQGSEDQLITTSRTGQPGVEVRRGSLTLTAESRLPRRGTLPAVAWSEDMQELDIKLHLPPGWDLLLARGVDEAADTWVSRWNLFDFFFVLVLSLGIAKLTRFAWGCVALVALALAHGHHGAPWILWLVLLVTLALLKVAQRGWFQQGLRLVWLATALSLLLVLADFFVDQVRFAIYPHLAKDSIASSFFEAQDERPAPQVAGSPATTAAPAEPMQQQVARSSDLETLSFSKTNANNGGAGGDVYQKGRQAKAVQHQDPNAVIQTGPGVPNWSFSNWSLRWSGPVEKGHELQLLLLSPNASRALTAARLLALSLLAWILFRASAIAAAPKAPQPPRQSRRARAATAGAVGALCLLFAPQLRAEVPAAEVLTELKTRLTRQANCDPNCLSVSELELLLNERLLEVRVDAHAGARTAYQLPGPARNWVPDSVTIDGKPSSALALRPDGFLYLQLEAGRHALKLTGRVSGHDLVLNPGSRPHRVRAVANGWEIDGINDAGLVENALQFTEKRKASDAAPEATTNSGGLLPPWLEVTRTLNVGVVWTLDTRVLRVSPTGAPLVTRFPLLPGEQVTTEGAIVNDGALVISLGRDQDAFEWSSTLPITDTLTFRAAENLPLSELWVLNCGPVWHCEAQGIAPFQHQAEGQWQPHFRPWPGEVLTWSFSRPRALPGSSLTIDAAHLKLAPGTRLLKGDLELRARSSTNGLQGIQLPQAVQVQALTVDGVAQPVRLEGSRLMVAVRPGAQRIQLEFQESRGLQLVTAAPSLDLGAAAVNGRIEVELPRERWLLLAGGPAWGPAILFWGYLLLLLVAAPLLARAPKSPLRAWQWAVLGLGLTQVPIAVAAVVVLWFFAMAFRESLVMESPWLRNGVQVALVFLTLGFLGCLLGAVYAGLVGSPDMAVAGAGSSDTHLVWYVDRIQGVLPSPWILSTPIWIWRSLNLFWALWLAASLLSWLRWGFGKFSSNGIWRPLGLWGYSRPAAAAGPPGVPEQYRERAKPAEGDAGAAPPPDDVPGARGSE